MRWPPAIWAGSVPRPSCTYILVVNDNRPPPRGLDPRARREPSQVIRRDPNYRPPPSWPPNPPTPQRRPPPPPRPRRSADRRPSHPPPRPPACRRRRKSLAANDIGAASCWRSCSCSSSRSWPAACWMDSSLHRIPALADYPERPAAGKGTTWLLVGSDSRQHLTPEQQAELTTGGDIGNGRTDTILLVHVPGLRVEHADHDGVHPARLLRADSRLRRGQDQRGVRCRRRSAAGADRRAGHRDAARPLRRDRVRRIRRHGRRGRRSDHVSRPNRSAIRSPASTCPRAARSSTAATRSATSAPAPPRGPTWIG